MTAIPVVYRYEIELKENFVPNIVQNDIVPKLELALNEELLPTLFGICQAEEGSSQTPGSPIVGISAARNDRVLDDGEY